MPSHLRRALGPYDVALIVIGSTIGSGIFRAPSVVAQRAPDAAIVLLAWAIGGIVALFGAFVLGELSARRPDGCGLYVYLRDAFHPIVGFAFGWASLVAGFSGGLAAGAILFAGYFASLTGLALPPGLVAAATLAMLALLNALGVREGATTQHVLTALKLGALLALVAAGLFAHSAAAVPIGDSLRSPLGAFAVAMIPVLFAYLGAQVVNFMAAETKDAARALPFGLTLGILGVAVVYVLVNFVCIRVLGVGGLASTDVPISAVLTHVAGPVGARLSSIAIALTTLGFISNRMLTVPRLYHAMAADGLFFRWVARVDPRTHVPVVAVFLQAFVAIAIALSSTYAHILNFVVVIAYGFAGLSALAIFVFRARDRRNGVAVGGRFRVPLHPFSTAIFMFASWGVALATCIAYPIDGMWGLGVVLSGVPVYAVWTRIRPLRKAAAL